MYAIRSYYELPKPIPIGSLHHRRQLQALLGERLHGKDGHLQIGCDREVARGLRVHHDTAIGSPKRPIHHVSEEFVEVRPRRPAVAAPLERPIRQDIVSGDTERNR